MGPHDRKHPIKQSLGIDRTMNFAGSAFRNTTIQPTWWEEASDRSSLGARGIRGPPPLFARLATPSPSVNYQPDRKSWRGQTSAACRHGKDQHQDHTCLGRPGRDIGPRPRSDRGGLGHHRADKCPAAHHPLLVSAPVEALKLQPIPIAPPEVLRRINISS
jgi:hypothetical protein